MQYATSGHEDKYCTVQPYIHPGTWYNIKLYDMLVGKSS